MMLHFEHWHCQFDKLSILSQLLLNLPTTYTHPLSLLQPLKFKCHQMGATHDVMSSGEQTCDVFSSLPVTFASAPSGKCPGASQKGNLMKEMEKYLVSPNKHLYLQNHHLAPAGWEAFAITHPHHLSACPALVWAAEQGSFNSSWSQGGGASPGEQMGEAAGLGGAASPDPNSTLLLAAISRREPIIWDFLNILPLMSSFPPFGHFKISPQQVHQSWRHPHRWSTTKTGN